jgi:hypothetical protein
MSKQKRKKGKKKKKKITYDTDHNPEHFSVIFRSFAFGALFKAISLVCKVKRLGLKFARFCAT